MVNIRWIWNACIRKSPWLMLLAVVLTMSMSVANILVTGLQQQLIDDVIVPGDWGRLPYVAALMGIAFIGSAVLYVFSPHVIHLLASRYIYILGDRYAGQLYEAPISWLQGERSGKIANYLTDIVMTGWMIGGRLPRFIVSIGTALILAYIIGKASLLMLGFSLLCSICYVALGTVLAKRIKKAARLVQEARSDLMVHLEEGISSTREVIAYHRMSWEKRIYDRLFGAYYQRNLDEAKETNRQLLSSEPFKWASVLFVLAYGGWQTLTGAMTIGTFVILFQFGRQMINSFQGLFMNAMEWSREMANVERVQEFLGAEKMDDGTKTLDRDIAQLSFNQVSFRYPGLEKDTLDGIDCELPIGCKIALVATSGGGKSTIAQLLARFHEPTSGHIYVNGTPLNEIRRNDWMSRIGVVFQEPYLYPASIRSNLTMGLADVTDGRLREICEIAQIDSFISGLPAGYDTVIGERGITLSGGQRQRVAVARALLRNPEILFLDEATSALDLTTERVLQQRVDKYRQGKTTIIAAHRLSTVRDADLILVLDHGAIVERGTHDELMAANTIYKSLVLSREDAAGAVV